MIIENNPSIRIIKHLTFRAVIISHEMFHGVGSFVGKICNKFLYFFQEQRVICCWIALCYRKDFGKRLLKVIFKYNSWEDQEYPSFFDCPPRRPSPSVHLMIINSSYLGNKGWTERRIKKNNKSLLSYHGFFVSIIKHAVDMMLRSVTLLA